MLLDDDVMTDGQPKPGAFAGRLGGEEGVEHLVFDVRRDTRSIVPYPDLDPITKVFGHSRQSRLKYAVHLSLALSRGVEAVRDQIEQDPCDFLWKHVRLAGGRIERPLERDVESLRFRPSP